MKKMWNKKIRNIFMAWILVISMVVPMFATGIAAEAADNTSVKDYNAMEMEDILDSKESLTWVFAGDSITHNGSWSQGMNSYSEWFEQYLYDIDRGDDSVVLTAWGGADIYDFQYAGDNTPGDNDNGAENNPGMGLENMITKYNPDVVFIKLGMNDRYKSTTDYVKFYNMMLDGVYAEGAKNNKIPKVVILTPTPLSGENLYDDSVYPDPSENIYDNTLRFRNALERIASERGLLFCDLRTAFLKEQLRLGDEYRRTFFSDPSDGAIHPNAAGQYLIFKTLSKTLGIYDEEHELYQLGYADANSAALYVDKTSGVTYVGGYDVPSEVSNRTVTWKDSVKETYVWAVAGAEQMSGYEGPVVNRSLFRLLDNIMRGGGSQVSSMRDVRLINLAKPGNTVASMHENYDATIGEHNHDVLLVLPEISQVYADNYVGLHSADLVNEYKSALKNLIAKEKGIVVLWTPLASNDATINSYIDDYADAVREIAMEDTSILFYDANKFMNNNMAKNDVLARNWFEEDMYISPLCVVDLVKSFYKTTGLSGTGIAELENYKDSNGDWVYSNHDLRLSTDSRKFKGEYVRDYIASEVTVSGTEVTIDVSAIKADYPSANIWLSVLPTVGAGNFNENIVELEVTADSENKFTFEAPCSNPVIAVYGSVDGDIYRFKDVRVDVTTSATIDTTPNPDGAYLNSLEVVGAPAFDFDADDTSYDVTLYQYQRNVQILAEAQPGLTITVNGEAVEAGENSQLITVDDTATVTVKVSGTVNGKAAEKTYTLNLVRPEYPDIIITEVMQDGYGNADQNGGDNYELIEIYNASGKDLNLKDYSIGYKKDYRYTGVATSGDAINYYFTGNNQAFQSINGAVQTYTGINKITKYSSYWSDDTVTEPEEINFPADSTMVIWVKFAAGGASDKEAYSKALTYDTLIAALKAEKDTHTLSVNGEAVVPTLDQLVVAEIPKGVSASGVEGSNQLAKNVSKSFYMDNHSAENNGSATRSWLFILGADATQSTVGAITEEGNNIVSASKFGRLNSTNKLSSVFYYDIDRGMSIVKDEAYYDVTTIGEGHTSDQQGYSNLTSFGAIEYWQKPYDFSDQTAPKVTNNTKSEVTEGTNASIEFTMSDETDLRYIELYVMKDGEIEWTKVTQDYVLESTVANSGRAKNVTGTKNYSFDLGKVTGTTQYYAVVSDGINVVELGSIDNPLEVGTLSKKTSGEVGSKIYVEVDGADVEVMVGDVNGDGKVNITDFVLVKAHLLKKRVLTGKYLAASDVNSDGRTNITDFVLIKRYLIK